MACLADKEDPTFIQGHVTLPLGPPRLASRKASQFEHEASTNLSGPLGVLAYILNLSSWFLVYKAGCFRELCDHFPTQKKLNYFAVLLPFLPHFLPPLFLSLFLLLSFFFLLLFLFFSFFHQTRSFGLDILLSLFI